VISRICPHKSPHIFLSMYDDQEKVPDKTRSGDWKERYNRSPPPLTGATARAATSS
jgi:hypothetical protein